MTPAQQILDSQSTSNVYAALLAPVWLSIFWSGAALMAKRLHDLNFSGFHAIWLTVLWYVSTTELPAIISYTVQLGAVITSLALLVMPGTRGPNKDGLASGMMIDRTPSDAIADLPSVR